MATTRAKFKCFSVTHYDGGGVSVSLQPVYSADPESENHAFWTASPSGKLEMSITNPAAAKTFEAGTEYYIDFTPAT